MLSLPTLMRMRHGFQKKAAGPLPPHKPYPPPQLHLKRRRQRRGSPVFRINVALQWHAAGVRRSGTRSQRAFAQVQSLGPTIFAAAETS
jgi:hypothetical protein